MINESIFGSRFFTFIVNRTNMRKILFPTDFSETSHRAFVYALHLADFLNCELMTLHVYDLPVVENQGLPSYMLEMYDVVETGQIKHYNNEMPFFKSVAAKNNLSNVKMSHKLMLGDLVDNIKELNKTENIDMIVMGTKGSSGVYETFMGSNATDVISSINAITMAIPDNCVYHAIKNICFTTELNEDDRKQLKIIQELAASLGAQIHVIHVVSDHKPENIEAWKTYFAAENVKFHIIENESVEDAITNFTETHKIDMLAMTHHKRTFFQRLFHHSITKSLAHHIQIPMVVIPDTTLI